MSKSSKAAFVLLAIVIALLSMLSIACDDSGTIDDLPRVGDGLKIAEALEAAVCRSQGGVWSNKTNRCN
jgi:hypothetical protein